MANEIVISEEEFDNITTTLSKSSSKTSYASQRLNGDFEGAVNSGLLGNSISVISRQMGLISKSMSNVQSIISEHSEQVLSFDRKLADKINEIEIPKDFLANDSAEVNTYTDYLVAKIDGKSITEGNDTKTFNDIDESTIDKEQLSDVTRSDVKEQYFDDQTSLSEKETVGNINEGMSQEEQHYNDSSELTSKSLETMDGEDLTTKVEYEDNTIPIENQTIEYINNEQTEMQEYEDELSINKTNVDNIIG